MRTAPALIFQLLIGSTLAAQSPIAIERLPAPILLDGQLNDTAWQQIAPVPLTLLLPVFGGVPTQRTEMRVGYDDENIYLAGWFYDTEAGAGGIRVNSLYRDRWNGDDAFAIYIDAFDDNRNAKWFGVTPAGMRFDQLVSDDGQTLNGSWDGFWEAKTSVTDEGWFAEVRIPFSTLGYRASADSVIMGLTVTRLVSRLNERVAFPAVDPRYQFRQPSVAQDVVLRNVRASTPLYVSPYIMMGVQRAPVLDSNAAGFRNHQQVVREAGLDTRYAMSSDLVLDVTLNTDFAEVEADHEQVNLDRFSLFFPEKRRFFQERAELFDFAMGTSGGRVFHSRRIGLGPNVRVPVLGGGRLVGRVGAWDIGLLNMQTEDIGNIAGENFGVGRARRAVFNDYSSIGGILTTRMGGDRSNVAYGLDGSFRIFGDDYLTVKAAQTLDDSYGDTISFLERTQTYVNWSRRSTRGLSYQISSTYSGSDYRPELGFLPRRNFKTANAMSEYFFFTNEHPVLRRFGPGALALSTFRNGDGKLESGRYAVWLKWETKRGGGGRLEPKLYRESVLRPFSIGGTVEIPARDYGFADLQLALFMNSGRRLRTNLDLSAGTYFDGTRIQMVATPTWNVSPHLELGADYQYTRLRFEDRAQKADIHVARVRARTALDARLSGNAFVQYNSTTHRIGLNFRVRYNFAEGTDLWLVYDEGLTTERHDPAIPVALPLSTGRAFVLKYTRTLQF